MERGELQSKRLIQTNANEGYGTLLTLTLKHEQKRKLMKPRLVMHFHRHTMHHVIECSPDTFI